MAMEKIVLRTQKMECAGCKTCATDYAAENMRHALARLNGVSKVKVDEVTGKVTIEYDSQKISYSKFAERLVRLGYRVEIESRGIP
ncbi:MAG: heavy metal-associated domain-containing protein [Candidatus Bathyarchaeia archaeon]